MTASARRSNYARLAPRLGLLLAGTVLGVGLVVLLLRSVDLSQLGDSFARADYGYLALGIVPFLLNLLLKVPRWALLYGEDAPDVDTLFGAINVGYSVNALLPARLGDLVRAYWVRDRVGLSMARTISTIALERVLDGITVLAMLLIFSATVSFPKQLLGSALAIGALFIVLLLAMLVTAHASRRRPAFARRIEALEQGRWAVAGRIVRQLVHGLQALHSRTAVALLIVYTLVIWSSNAVLAWLVLQAFHLHAPLAAGFLVVAVLNLGMAVPSSPGYLESSTT